MITLNKQAFNAGWRGFFIGDPEVSSVEGKSDIWYKEFTRGWNAAFAKALRNCS